VSGNARLLGLALAWGLTTLSCGEPLDPPGDNVPPASVRDLEISLVTQTEVDLRWTATGDDKQLGRAKGYRIGYSSQLITPDTFGAADTVNTKGLIPSPVGQRDSIRVESLQPAQRYFFALVVVDDAGNESALSNVVSAVTLSRFSVR
jgi:hypothetical protein